MQRFSRNSTQNFLLISNKCLTLFLGNYVYIETSWSSPNDSATLLTSANLLIPATTTAKKCLKFWYHMYGAHVDKLRVYLRVNSKFASLPVWEKSGGHGDVWRYAQIQLNSSSDFQVHVKTYNLLCCQLCACQQGCSVMKTMLLQNIAVLTEQQRGQYSKGEVRYFTVKTERWRLISSLLYGNFYRKNQYN